jgi:glycosyltransferase involved in cell wall biosynthesis
VLGLAFKHAPVRKRVGLVYRSGRPGEKAWSGIPSGLARGLSHLGFDAVFIDAEPRGAVTRIAKAWAMVVHRNRHGGMYAPEIRELRRLTARLRASRMGRLDAIIQMGSDFGVPLAGKRVTYEDMTVVQRVHVDNLEPVLGAGAIKRWIQAQAKCYEVAIGCCVASQWAADSIMRDYCVDPRKVHVVGAGRNYEPRPIKRDWSQPRFLFVGYDWERKNGPMLLRAFGHLKNGVPEARLDIAGGHPRIDMDGVFTYGALDFSNPRDRAQVEALFESATCFVMPSKFEPFGIVYVEAAAAGVPSIGTLVGGARDAIGDAAGLLVDPSDEHALVEAMAIMSDPRCASMMGAAAAERSSLFTWTAVAERIAPVLELPVELSSEPLKPVSQ